MEAIEHNWNIISQVVDHHEDTLINIYNSYKDNEVNEQQLSDMITEFVLENAEEFNGLLRRDFNYQIENFVVKLCKSIKIK